MISKNKIKYIKSLELKKTATRKVSSWLKDTRWWTTS